MLGEPGTKGPTLPTYPEFRTQDPVEGEDRKRGFHLHGNPVTRCSGSGMGISGTQGQGTKTGKAHEGRSGKMVVVYVSTCNPGMDIARAVVCGRLFVGYPKAHPP